MHELNHSPPSPGILKGRRWLRQWMLSGLLSEAPNLPEESSAQATDPPSPLLFFHGNNEKIIPHPGFPPDTIFSATVCYRNTGLVLSPSCRSVSLTEMRNSCLSSIQRRAGVVGTKHLLSGHVLFITRPHIGNCPDAGH